MLTGRQTHPGCALHKMLLRDPLPDPGAGAGWRALSSRTASSRGKRESGLDGDGGNDAPSASPRSEGSLWRPWGAQAGTAVPGSAAPAMPGALGPGPGGAKERPLGLGRGGVSPWPPAGRRRPRGPRRHSRGSFPSAGHGPPKAALASAETSRYLHVSTSKGISIHWLQIT